MFPGFSAKWIHPSPRVTLPNKTPSIYQNRANGSCNHGKLVFQEGSSSPILSNGADSLILEIALPPTVQPVNNSCETTTILNNGFQKEKNYDA